VSPEKKCPRHPFYISSRLSKCLSLHLFWRLVCVFFLQMVDSISPLSLSGTSSSQEATARLSSFPDIMPARPHQFFTVTAGTPPALDHSDNIARLLLMGIPAFSSFFPYPVKPSNLSQRSFPQTFPLSPDYLAFCYWHLAASLGDRTLLLLSVGNISLR